MSVFSSGTDPRIAKMVIGVEESFLRQRLASHLIISMVKTITSDMDIKDPIEYTMELHEDMEKAIISKMPCLRHGLEETFAIVLMEQVDILYQYIIDKRIMESGSQLAIT